MPNTIGACKGRTIGITVRQSHYYYYLPVHMVQLVGGFLLQPLVRGSKPSGVGLLLESMVGG
jgi:hypothetical protein